MQWTAIEWIVIAIVAILVMARGCGGMMGGVRSGGCGMPRPEDTRKKDSENPPAGKAA